MSVLPGRSRASIKPEDLCTAEKGKMTPPSNGLTALLPPFLHTVLNFYSFSSFLPSDGLLCVQAVGKFPVMVRSSTTNNPPHTHTQTHHHTHSLRCPSLSTPGSKSRTLCPTSSSSAETRSRMQPNLKPISIYLGSTNT